MGLSDDLGKLDIYVEQITRQVLRTIGLPLISVFFDFLAEIRNYMVWCQQQDFVLCLVLLVPNPDPTVYNRQNLGPEN